MKAKVTEDCIACGVCVDLCPQVFQMGEQFAEVQVNPVPSEHEQAVKESAEECPTNAIELE